MAMKTGHLLIPAGATAQVPVTGLGFTPTNLLTRTVLDTGTTICHGAARSPGTANQSHIDVEVAAGASVTRGEQDRLAKFLAPNPANIKIFTWDADGFTLIYDLTTSALNAVLQWLAWDN